jgi:hypothetical protein
MVNGILRAAVGVLLTGALLGVAAPASAATSGVGGDIATRSSAAAPAVNRSGAAGKPISVHTYSGVAAAGGASPQAACAITVYGYTGYRVCGFDYSSFDWGGGNVEYFVVGTNYAIFHIWLNSGGWKSLGGQADRAAPNGAYAYLYGVETIGTDGYWWCRDWPYSSGWYQC